MRTISATIKLNRHATTWFELFWLRFVDFRDKYVFSCCQRQEFSIFCLVFSSSNGGTTLALQLCNRKKNKERCSLEVLSKRIWVGSFCTLSAFSHYKNKFPGQGADKRNFFFQIARALPFFYFILFSQRSRSNLLDFYGLKLFLMSNLSNDATKYFAFLLQIDL